MRRAPFSALVKTFRERGLLVDSIHTSVEEHIAMFLHDVGHNLRFRVVCNIFKRSMETISRYFQQVLYVVGELRGEMIKALSRNTPRKIKNNYRWFPYFRVSTTHVRSVHPIFGMVTNITLYSLLHRIVLGLSMVLMSQQGVGVRSRKQFFFLQTFPKIYSMYLYGNGVATVFIPLKTESGKTFHNNVVDEDN
jgi:hypothetical protein